MKYRFALIGCGKIAPRHAEQMVKVGTITAVCDTDRNKADSLARQYDVNAYYHLDDLLKNEKEIDIVSICTPNYLHATQTIQCLKNYFHVLCEKPMALNEADGKKMLRIAFELNRNLFIVKQNRFNPPVQAVKKILDEGKLGKVHAFVINCFWNRTSTYYNSPWKGKIELDGGILFTQFSHFVDLLVWFLGEAEDVKAIKNNFLLKDIIEFEDTGFAVIKMQNGALGSLNYTITSFAQNMEGSFTLFGETGTVKIGGPYLNTLEYFNVRNEIIPSLQNIKEANRYGLYQGSMSNHDIVYKNLINALNNTYHTIVDGSEALKSVRIIEQIYRASNIN